MKYFYYTFFTFSTFFTLEAQNCLPDSTLIDSATGVYPRPVSMDYPNGGIKKKACINKPYDFTFTVVVPDSVLIPPLTTPIPMDKASIDTIGAISNLPKGINYLCNPPDCIFKKNTFGCLILTGTPDGSNAPGEYKPVINLKVTVSPIGFPIDYNLKYPGPEFPGEYILNLLPENDCVTSVKDEYIGNKYWYPNPSDGIININTPHVENLKIYKLNGKLVYSNPAFLKQSIDGDELNLEGIYILHWIENGSAFHQKIIFLP